MSDEPSQIEQAIEKTLPKLDAYFDHSKNRYWYKNRDQQWIPLVKDDVMFVLEEMNYSTKPAKGKSYSIADHELARVRMEQSVGFAGQVAGHKEGLIVTDSEKILVTKSPRLVEPVTGDWSKIKELGTRLFGEEQFGYVLGWSSTAVKSLYKGEYRQVQMLVLAGAARCGKSFWQHNIVTPMLGGRVARPLQYMTGGTGFNEDIIKSEHLLMEDENPRKDFQGRRQLGAAVKNFTVNATQRLHGKGKDALVVPSRHWVTLSMNDEQSNLAVLPVMDENVTDKIIITKCHGAFEDNWVSRDDMPRFQETIKSQIPAFVHYLLNEHTITEDMSDFRFGVKTYQNPELVAAMHDMSEEGEFDSMIDILFTTARSKGEEVKFEASAIQDMLLKHESTSFRARKLLYYSTASGVFMGKLAQKLVGKYVKPGRNDRPKIWKINFKDYPGA